MSENKKQHFVPKMYLELFAKGNLICQYNTKNKQFINPQPFKSLCCINYFYKDGKGNNIQAEQQLSKIEGKCKKAIDGICQGINSIENIIGLKQFITIQFLRTPKHNNNFKKNISLIFDSLKLKQENPILPNSLLKGCDLFYKIILDLKVYIIRSHSDDFITSDNPVIMYNQFFGKSGNVNHTGIMEKGIIIICPLSSRTVAILYDGNIYREISKVTEDDLYHINLLSFLNSDKIVLFHPNYDKNIFKFFENYKNENPNIEGDLVENFYFGKKIIKKTNDKLNFDYKFSFLQEIPNLSDYDINKNYNRK